MCKYFFRDYKLYATADSCMLKKNIEAIIINITLFEIICFSIFTSAARWWDELGLGIYTLLFPRSHLHSMEILMTFLEKKMAKLRPTRPTVPQKNHAYLLNKKNHLCFSCVGFKKKRKMLLGNCLIYFYGSNKFP
jgi:hypothetical protein